MIPHLKYLEACTVLKWSPEKIQENFTEIGLEFNLKAAQIVYHTLKTEQPDYFANKEPLDIQWLEQLQIAPMYSYLTSTPLPGHPTDHLKGAFNLLDDPLMYRLVTSLAITKLSDEDIELIASSRQNFSYGVEEIKEFLFYFFNLDNWTLKQRKTFVDSITEEQLAKYYKLALKGEKEYLFWKLGVNPDKPYDLMLNEMLQDSFFNFKEVAKIHPELAQKWATLAMRVADKLDKESKDQRNGVDGLDGIEFIIKTVDRRDETPRRLEDLEDDPLD